MNRKRSNQLAQSVCTMVDAYLSKHEHEIDLVELDPTLSGGIGYSQIRYLSRDGKNRLLIEQNDSNFKCKRLKWSDLSDYEKEELNRFLVEKLDGGDYSFRVCSKCGMAFTEGYYLTDYYACSDECMLDYYMSYEGVHTRLQARRKFLLEYMGVFDEDEEVWYHGRYVKYCKLGYRAIKELADGHDGDDYAYWTTWN